MTTATSDETSLHETTVQGHRFEIQAAPDVSGPWRATVVSYTFGAGAHPLARDGSSPLRILEDRWSGIGPNAEAAIANLDGHIRATLTKALADADRAELEEANRRYQQRMNRRRPSWEG